MSWQDRLQPDITLISPTGEQFTAYWSGDPREVEKKLGIFEYPLVAGAIVQDLDVRATRWPLSFAFEGEDHDLTAGRFFAACKQRGPWRIYHPVHGLVTLYPLFVQEDIQPVESSNVTAIKSDWIEPIGGFTGRSSAQRAAVVRERVFRLQDTAAGQFAAVARPDRLAQFRAAVTGAQTTIRNTLKPLTQTVAEVNAAVESVHRGVTETITDASLNVLALGGQIQTLVTLPAMTVESIGVRLDHYSGLLAGMLSGLGTDVNDLATGELTVTAVLAAAATIITDGDPATREEALIHLETVGRMFTELTAGLDAGQTDTRIDERYFSQSVSFNDAALLVAAVSDLLLRQLFDLAAARRITLQRHRCPVEIALTEGVDLDLFIASNGLTGEEILLLPAGREVVVYL
jgi:prophage DNA circulation protein